MLKKFLGKTMPFTLAAVLALGVAACGNAKNDDENDILSNAAGQQIIPKIKTWQGELPPAIGEFKTVDLDGNEVTESIFSGKDLTVVNIWGTFCSPCIEEMPELGAWAKEMPENVQIVGLVQDISTAEDTKHLELAKQITSKADADFVQLIAGTDDFAEVMTSLVGVPTTIFVDSNGNIVGEPILGADVDGYKKFVEEYLNEQ